jgi:glycosyltransferase involved in cell wall biosynthesis
MRFLMLNWRDPRNPRTGGAERVSLAYLLALQNRGHEVFWYANHFAGAPAEERVDGLQVVRGGGKGTSVLKAMSWYRRQKPFDLVIDQHHGIPWFAPWWCRTRCVAYIHEVLGPIWEAFYSWPLSTLGRCQERATHWLYRRVPFWVPSESTRKALLQNGVREVMVLPNGTDATPLSELEAKQLAQPVRLVVVCRLAPNKRVGDAILALDLVVRKGIDARLTIVGNGESESSLRQMVAKLELDARVVFTGQLSEAAKDAELRRAHLLVHTSIREGWGLNVIEANAMGTPALVYPVAGLVDSTVHEQTGLVTMAETPQALAEALAGLMQDPTKYQRLRVGAWQRSKDFQWSRVLPLATDWLEKQAAGRAIRSVQRV